ncbi:unnamed protein product [Cuscuta campestris]|uniref:Polysaccharide biosynthesis protein C-terminal domain-containing protein n=1 Tax=Cuscuta campestris TaxID=132261 RepID=A0A484NB38_9ASTE|nr:unnamed protein product [Cuscuta campestris]
MFMAIAQGFLIAAITVSLRSLWGHVYTKDIDVIRRIASLMPVLALSSFWDGIQSVLSGIARGSGWQKSGSVINFAAYYILGIPLAIVLGFVLHLKSMGLWLGLISALAVQAINFTILTMRTNWEHEAMQAAIRIQKQMIVTEGSRDVVEALEREKA